VIAPFALFLLQAEEAMREGLRLASQGRNQGAVALLRRACEAKPPVDGACYMHARNLFTLGRYTDAIAPFASAVSNASPDTRWRALRGAAMNYQALDRPADAERTYREAARLNPKEVGADLGALLVRQGRADEALEPLKAAGDSARTRTELGRALLQLDRAAEAATHLERAVALSPKDWPARLLLGRAYLALGRTADADRELRSAQKGMESGVR
jgi:Flp pilus assembly protein TadD